jgi:hypothetical protein
MLYRCSLLIKVHFSGLSFPATRGTTVYLLRGETAEEQLQLFDASGRQVFSMAITDKLTPISTNILPPGFYSYTIMQAGSRKKAGRVLIQ